ncbi:MAG: VOC family protein [Phenylobacterium sp.]|uniref:VOC family protein n=1 Tax=Phenylobacterium sp. TaxID=1871053 RepID=UPI001A54C24B|nr:VOC family protein [Phenylobacterium sp.]MBL8554954.1 VOC family protein [Phenylobacterium sp.]
MRIRQIALVGEDLDRAKAEIVDVLGLGKDYPDPGVGHFGLHNAVWPVGDTFLEVVAPVQAGTTAGRLLEKRGGDGGYMVIMQVDDMAAARRHVADIGVRIVHETDRDDGKVACSHLHPRDVGGAILSLDAMTPKERWEWGGPDWQTNVRTDISLEIVGAELQGDDPEAMATRWGEVMQRPVSYRDGRWIVGVDGGEIRFVPVSDGRGEGLRAFDVKVRDPDAVRARAKARGAVDADGTVKLCGTRVELVKA